MEEAYHRRGYGTVAAVIGGGKKPRGEALLGSPYPAGWSIWDLRGRTLHETGKLTRLHGRLQRLQLRQKDGGARRGGTPRASAHEVSGQVLRHRTRRRVFPDGLREDQGERLL